MVNYLKSMCWSDEFPVRRIPSCKASKGVNLFSAKCSSRKLRFIFNELAVGNETHQNIRLNPLVHFYGFDMCKKKKKNRIVPIMANDLPVRLQSFKYRTLRRELDRRALANKVELCSDNPT